MWVTKKFDNNFEYKIFFDQQNFKSEEISNPKKFWSERIRVQGLQNFTTKKFLFKFSLWTKKVLVKLNFGQKKLIQKN